MTSNEFTSSDFTAIAERIASRVVVRDDAPPTAPDLAAERLARRTKAMAAIGWERRALHLVASPAYDEARATGYLEAIRAIDTPAGGVVVLAGNKGSGKTAAAARWAYTRRREAPRMMRAAEFFRSSRYTRRDEKPDGALDRDELLRVPALVLDDVGAEFADSAGSYRVDFDELVDRFYADGRVLVLTTNLVYATPAQRDAAKADPSIATFQDRYGERVTDRIRECGKWVSSSAPSMRGAK